MESKPNDAVDYVVCFIMIGTFLGLRQIVRKFALLNRKDNFMYLEENSE